MKKTTGITYEELMSSRFIDFPGHNQSLYAVCNPFFLCFILIMISAAFAIIFGVSAAVGVMSTALACVIILKFQIILNSTMVGHGVGLIKKGRFSLFGLSTGITIMVCVLSLLTTLMLCTSFLGTWESRETGLNFKYLSLLWALANLFAIASWKYHIYYLTWYGDEYRARMQFKDKGCSEKEIDSFIEQLKEKGILSKR